MHRLAIRPLAKVSLAHAAPRVSRATRFLSTAPPHRQSRSWKNSLFRWGLAGAIVYYYNTSSVFADEPQYATHRVPEPPRSAAPSYARDSNVEQARRRNERDEPTDTQSASLATTEVTEEQSAIASPEELEAEAGQQGAFNEETGEINWDCPCLGGMAYGPCGEQFRAAFSCFVFSKEDPKGIECIDHFKTMQNCFREHPDIYGSELEEDEVADAIDADTSSAPSPARSETDASHGPRSSEVAAGHADAKPSAEKDVKEARGRAQATAEQVRKDYQPADEKDNLVPRAAHDAR